ncbi:hypothetical protein FA13DRAFT_1740935, partial [Coprinellus micaceus]
MANSPQQRKVLEIAVAEWRVQEYITIPFYTLYVYLCLTTMGDEVAYLTSKRGKTGKGLFLFMKYGTILHFLLRICTSYRMYFDISPQICKGLSVLTIATLWLIALTADVTLGLCVSALLQLGRKQLLAVVTLFWSLPVVYLVIQLICYSQVTVAPLSRLDQELGYPCSTISGDEVLANLPGGSLAILSYLNFARAMVFVVLAIVTLVVRRRRYRGALTGAVIRDGTLYYIASAAIRLLYAVVNTPALFSADAALASPIQSLVTVLSAVVIPILAQGFLLRIRTIDTLGSTSLASKILFASCPTRSSDEDLPRHTGTSVREGPSGIDSPTCQT